jgi:putative pyruvate formate lyase activating enzyme
MQEKNTRLQTIMDQMHGCNLCGNQCNTDRLAGDVSVCGAGPTAEVSHIEIHHGEEPPISGTRGCGNIFFHNCSLSCVYCQNWQISNANTVAKEVLTVAQLADEMLRLQEAGVQTLGLVAPTSHIPTLVPALYRARGMGLQLPVVYNSGGYDTVAALRLLEGLVDVYLPDMKYGSDEVAQVYSGVIDYVDVNRRAVEEMLRQVGPLQLSQDGIARRGLLIRHLILPGGMADTVDVLTWIARNVPRTVTISLMSQYTPKYQAADGFFPEINRKLTQTEYDYYLAVADELGLTNLFTQDLTSADVYAPDFSLAQPFERVE